MSVSSAGPEAAAVAFPRGMLLAQVWAQLGDSVAALSNSSGRPLARTVKLILDPLVLRPVRNPQFAGTSVRAEHAEDFRRAITDAAEVLAATAAWFLELKRARRHAKITEGNPQDLYFQRCYELAHIHGTPRAAIAAEAVREIHTGTTVSELRGYVTDPAHSGELGRLLRLAWAGKRDVPAVSGSQRRVADFLTTCATAPEPDLFESLVSARVGSGAAAELEQPGVAAGYGLTDHARIVPPELGEKASKKTLPKPLDRSILERLFSGFHLQSKSDVASLVRHEIHRSAQPWQLAEEHSRITMVLGRDASADLDGTVAATDAQARLRSRWQREAYVHRVLRMPSGVPEALRDDVRSVHGAYLRRLWVRLHGRELRDEELAAHELWDVLDGVLRSVIMDQRDRLRSALGARQ
ncbi:hypothetical protein [Allokutzneria oryzae]|uniref:Uncharacterized protein n=1 Tax=Allokutzneria oryzae TaxID=1378989 RepID=A0ABV6A997_9PSEU